MANYQIEDDASDTESYSVKSDESDSISALDKLPVPETVSSFIPRALETQPAHFDPVQSLRRGKSKLKRNASQKSAADPTLVTWDGPKDHSNPKNWPKSKKWTATLLVSCFTFISPVASTMVAPALGDIADEYHITSSIEKILVMSIFLLAYAVGPFLWGPLSEVFGRVRVLQAANIIYLLFNTVCGFAQTKQQMMAFRFLSGIGGSAPQAIGGGVLSDCFRAEDRGSAIAVYSLMPFIGPALGPVAGGYITQYTTWRWVFWSTSIFDAAVQVLALALLPETYPAAILLKKAKELRKQTGNQELHTDREGPDHSMGKIMTKSLARPFIMLCTQPALQLMSLFRAYLYGLMYLVLATFPTVFQQSYDQSVSQASLNYLSLGVGFVGGLQVSGRLQDRTYAYCKRHQIDPCASLFAKANWALPEYRLPLALPFSILVPIGLFIYGWSAQAQAHWFVPNMGACIFAFGLIICFNCAQAYVVDTYNTYAASATGAAAFVRTMAGFSFPLFAPKMYDSLGVGWGNSLLAFVSLGLGIVAPIAMWRWGIWLRSKSTYCVG
ncbi:uncharacterized protein A1O9_11717 [Exophiala aquamarina CBS 119918]|uniref:Major facilitator superfamily (MFS) profile domain-containing protein n=1 Tax=Exophiala aquamarina CBS 119918 TaxID=1182545 RepID=A0A072NWV5_9EURO|nr:uncharacterized protein A1O9_11717 [Exophiala aquamarina CBS 119918]KEF52091.1 hypothetical protein A1O9_11717 [Exophiala aquamarina CBS 119918]